MATATLRDRRVAVIGTELSGLVSLKSPYSESYLQAPQKGATQWNSSAECRPSNFGLGRACGLNHPIRSYLFFEMAVLTSKFG
jgi:hypothetical protein